MDDAVVKLRNAISGAEGLLGRIWKTVRVFWHLLKLAAAAFVLFVIEGIVFYYIFGSVWLFLAAFLCTIAFLYWRFWAKVKGILGIVPRPKGSILIGKAYPHATESTTGDGHTAAVEVGAEQAYYIDYLHQPNHHVLINGSTSSGKTVTMLSFVARTSLVNGLNFLMIDWNGENEEWAKDVGATVWKVPLNFKVNLFMLNGLSKESRASLAVESLTVSARLTALQATKVKSALLRFYMEGKEPSLFDLWSSLCSRDAGKANVLNQRLRAIQRVIGYEPEEFWNGIFSRNNLISLAGLNESEKSLVVYALMQRLAELFDKRPELNKQLRLMVVMDEAWQFFRRERDFDAHRESSLEKVVRLGRKYGFGLIISTQQIEDVPKVFINSCSLVMLHQQREYRYFGQNVLNLGEYDSAYLRSAGQGEMLLFDRGMTQSGRWWSDYVKVAPLTDGEVRTITAGSRAYVPETILEPEMPIEQNDRKASGVRETGKSGIFEGTDIPSVAVYRFMICIDRTKSLTDAYAMLREKGWLTSLSTLYGGKSKPSILARAAGAGYVSQDAKLTEKGLDVINSERIIARQGIYAGSEEHKELMRKTIRMVQDNGNFAFTTSDKDSFDIGEIRARGKAVWDFERIIAYECQTNAIKEELEKAINRAREFNTKPIFVTPSEKVSDAVRAEVGNNYVSLNA